MEKTGFMQFSQSRGQVRDHLHDLLPGEHGGNSPQGTDLPTFPFAGFPTVKRKGTRRQPFRVLKEIIVDSRDSLEREPGVGEDLETGMENPIARGLGLEDTDHPPGPALMQGDKRPSEGIPVEKSFQSIAG